MEPHRTLHISHILRTPPLRVERALALRHARPTRHRRYALHPRRSTSHHHIRDSRDPHSYTNSQTSYILHSAHRNVHPASSPSRLRPITLTHCLNQSLPLTLTGRYITMRHRVRNAHTHTMRVISPLFGETNVEVQRIHVLCLELVEHTTPHVWGELCQCS